MIKINLLPREQRRKSGRVRAPRAGYAAMAVLAVVGMWGCWLMVRWDMAQLQADIVATKDNIARHQQVVRLVEQYTRDQKQRQERLTVVQRLAASQNSPVRLLDGISQALPEGGWLTSINKVSGKLVIQGYASSHFVVAEMMLALQQLTQLVNSVELSFSELELYEGRPVERFEILLTLSE
ncbi:Pili assembly protein [Candidatus Methylomirabilis lanthanidiphila]|uniref:Pili assembly protein n=1 Tax=Candidatus Methylomirabilis lanthanidiphila TaxID=2211376 RepID=A0A564ZGU5_9BACT|nr:PilN domain-containing protein [Candidatus Methylomirabilis lanthanidiphila]VUZ84383.1 Pili assembly protein [Candidatus Methylomirabilis lanthanidiphila]